MIRDVLRNVISMILREQFYALATIVIGSLFILLHCLEGSNTDTLIDAISTALILR
jgi:uncharacterized membrane protein YeiH